MNIDSTTELRTAIRHPYAWPGGYQTVIVMSDGEIICHECARENYRLLSKSLKERSNDGWRPCAWELFLEGEDETCCNCGKQISPN